MNNLIDECIQRYELEEAAQTRSLLDLFIDDDEISISLTSKYEFITDDVIIDN